MSLASVNHRSAFSLIEVLVVMSILSLIVLVLMSVFNSTQAAFRAGVTQSDVLEGSRSAMELITADLKLMAASGGYSNSLTSGHYVQSQSGVSFYANGNSYSSQSFIQNLPGSNETRTNVVQDFFFLSQANLNGVKSWIGTGYTVAAARSSPLFALYRFSTNIPASSDPAILFNTFMAAILGNDANYYNFTNTGWSHLIDGVVDLRVRAYDAAGYQMTNTYQFYSGQWFTNQDVLFLPPQSGEAGFYFFGKTLPATVELQVGVLEDRALQRTESLGALGAGLSPAQQNYLLNQAGRIHIFRQRVTIPNLDRTPYQ